jgi:hypothetical protein
MLIVRSPRGMVRSTARWTRLRACPTTEDVFGLQVDHLDAPAGRVAGNEVGGCGEQVGGDEREVVAGGGTGLADEDDADRGRVWNPTRPRRHGRQPAILGPWKAYCIDGDDLGNR